LSKCTILLLQEHWLSDEQPSSLACISSNIAYTGITGFGMCLLAALMADVQYYGKPI